MYSPTQLSDHETILSLESTPFSSTKTIILVFEENQIKIFFFFLTKGLLQMWTLSIKQLSNIKSTSEIENHCALQFY